MIASPSYASFLDAKQQVGGFYGFDPVWMPEKLFPFQVSLVEWACRKGRAAIFADCGLGKTFVQLTWAENVARKSGGRVLILTPLAVAFQTVKEGEKIGVEVTHRRDGLHDGDRIVVTNYERLHHFNTDDFAGVVCDESSILKNFDGETRKAITDFMRKRQYRLLCTATAAPNDYVELGTSSEALGDLGSHDMLSRFFKQINDPSAVARRFAGSSSGKVDVGGLGKYMMRPHAERDFWRWVCSWARAMRKPSDLGFDDGAFVLPPLSVRQHVVRAARPRDGFLFDIPAVGLAEQRSDLRNTIQERCETAAALVNAQQGPSICWCNLNEEGKRLNKLIPNSVEVSGEDSEELKEDAIRWFSGEMCSCVLTTKHKSIKLQPCEHQKKTSPTCDGTTPSTQRSSGARQNSSAPTTIGGERDTQKTKDFAKPAKHLPAKEILNQNGTEDCAQHLESESTRTTPYSDNRMAAAQFADQSKATRADAGLRLTTATEQEKSAGSCAPTAIKDSESSKTHAHYCCEHPSTLKRTLISKPSIFGFGVNLQHCAHQTYFPSHSYEQYYQSVRRCWRFGQRNPVTVDLITTDGQENVLANLQRKTEQASVMFDQLVAMMCKEMKIVKNNDYTKKEEHPSWL